MDWRIFSRHGFLCLLAGVLWSLSATGQNISVASFTPLPNDMEARTLNPVTDANGDLSALLKVVTTETGFNFTGGSLGIVRVNQQPGEYWVYVPSGARTLTIRHPQLGVLRNYAYPVAITAGSVYEMKLVHGELEVSVKEKQLSTEFVIITSEPPGADVYLNNEPVGKTPFSAEKTEGNYEWRVASDIYLPESGSFELVAGEKQEINLKLRPNFGTLEIISEPESGATISLNGVKLGKQTPFNLEEVPAGEQTLTLSHEWYETTTRKVNVLAGESEQVRISMQPNFAALTVEAGPDEEVYLNDSKKGSGKWQGRLAPGVYRVEVRKAGHKAATRQLSLSRGDDEVLTLTPEPIYSALKVISEPMGAEIYVDGVLKGTTPHIVRDLLVGEYELELRKEGFSHLKRRVTVAEGVTLEFNEALGVSGELHVNIDPVGAEIYINKVLRGVAPEIFSDIEQGEYDLEIRKDGFETLSTKVEVKAGRAVHVDKKMKMVMASLTVTSKPSFSRVFLDGRIQEKTPTTIPVNMPGFYSLEIHHHGYKPISKTIRLRPGEDKKVHYKLRKTHGSKLASQKSYRALGLAYKGMHHVFGNILYSDSRSAQFSLFAINYISLNTTGIGGYLDLFNVRESAMGNFRSLGFSSGLTLKVLYPFWAYVGLGLGFEFQSRAQLTFRWVALSPEAGINIGLFDAMVLRIGGMYSVNMLLPQVGLAVNIKSK